MNQPHAPRQTEYWRQRRAIGKTSVPISGALYREAQWLGSALWRDRQTGRQTDRQTGRWIGRQTGATINRQVGQTSGLTDG